MSLDASARRYAATTVMCCGLFLLGLDLTILNVAIPDLQRRLEPSMAQVQWIVDGYALVLGGTVLALGAVTDRMGRRRAFITGLAICGAAGTAGAVAEAPAQIIAARCGMGAGAALLMPATLSVITNLFPEPALRRRAIALWAVIGSAGGLTGPLVGGWLVEQFSWRAGFWINLPVAALTIALALWLVPETRAARSERLDLLGAALASAALLTLIWAVIEAPRLGWTSTPVVTGYVASAVLLVVFVRQQSRCAHPMLPLWLLRTGRISASALAMAMSAFGTYGALFLMTLYLQGILGYTPWQAGVHTLPLLGALGLGAVLALPLLARGEETPPIILGLLLSAVAFTVLAGTQADSGYPRLVVFQLIAGVGGGMVAAAATEAIMNAVPPDRAGLGSAVNDATRQVGACLGVAVQGSVLTTVCTSRLDTFIQGHELPSHLPSTLARGTAVTDDLTVLPASVRTELLTTARHAFIDGLTAAAITAAAVTLAAAAASYALHRRRMAKPFAHAAAKEQAHATPKATT